MAQRLMEAARRLLLPEMRQIIREELTAISERVKRIEDSMATKDLLQSVRNELIAKIEGLEKRMDLVQQVAVLQTKIMELEEKLGKR